MMPCCLQSAPSPQCWVNRPLNDDEVQQLHTIGALGGHLAAALPLLAHELHLSSLQLHHLYPDKEERLVPTLEEDACTRYLLQAASGTGGWGPNPGQQLTQGELQRVMHMRLPAQPVPMWRRLGQCPLVELPPCPIKGSVVKEHEARLAALVVPGRAQGPQSRAPYPLSSASGGKAATPLGQEMHDELSSSWDENQGLSVATNVVPDTRAGISEVQVWHLTVLL